MKNIKTIASLMLLMTSMIAYADQELVVKTDNEKEGFSTFSRIVLDLTGEKPVIRNNDKSVVYTSDSPLIIQVENTGDENAINNIKAHNTTDKNIYDLSGRIVEKPKRGIYIQNGKKFVLN